MQVDSKRGTQAPTASGGPAVEQKAGAPAAGRCTVLRRPRLVLRRLCSGGTGASGRGTGTRVPGRGCGPGDTPHDLAYHSHVYSDGGAAAARSNTPASGRARAQTCLRTLCL